MIAKQAKTTVGAKGIDIVSVYPRSLACQLKLQRGDFIQTANGIELASLADFSKAVYLEPRFKFEFRRSGITQTREAIVYWPGYSRSKRYLLLRKEDRRPPIVIRVRVIDPIIVIDAKAKTSAPRVKKRPVDISPTKGPGRLTPR